MADKTIESIYASAIVIDEAYVTTSGSASEIDTTAALAALAASSAGALTAAGLRAGSPRTRPSPRLMSSSSQSTAWT